MKILRVVADPNRLRILLLLKAEELSVAELQEILVMGQSTISTHLSQLKQAGLVEDRRTGKSSLYQLTIGNGNDVLAELLARAEREIPEAAPTAPQLAASSRNARTRCAPSSTASPDASAKTTFPASPGKASPKPSSA